MAKVLLVEDYPSLQKIYETALRDKKHSVDLARNGAEGLQKVSNHKYDIILLDILMPQVDGLEFLRSFGAANHPNTSVIIISNVYSDDLLNQALKSGARHYLLKSDITPQHLVDVVDTTIAEHKKSQTS